MNRTRDRPLQVATIFSLPPRRGIKERDERAAIVLIRVFILTMVNEVGIRRVRVTNKRWGGEIVK